MSEKNKGILEMLACATLWSIAGIFIKLIDANPFVIAGFRSLFAAIVVGIYILITKKKILFTKTSIINSISMCVLYFLFVGANKLTTAANVIVLEYTSPIFIMIFSAVFLKAKLKRSDILAALCTLIGIAFCFSDQLQSGYILGNIISVCAGAVMASVYMYVGEMKDENEKFTGVLFGQVLTAVIGLSFMFFTKSNLVPISFVYLGILGVFQMGISSILLALSSKSCPPLACCLLAAVEPLLNPIWVAIFDGEKPGFMALIGGIIVIVTVTIWCIYDAKDKK